MERVRGRIDRPFQQIRPHPLDHLFEQNIIIVIRVFRFNAPEGFVQPVAGIRIELLYGYVGFRISDGSPVAHCLLPVQQGKHIYSVFLGHRLHFRQQLFTHSEYIFRVLITQRICHAVCVQSRWGWPVASPPDFTDAEEIELVRMMLKINVVDCW